MSCSTLDTNTRFHTHPWGGDAGQRAMRIELYMKVLVPCGSGDVDRRGWSQLMQTERPPVLRPTDQTKRFEGGLFRDVAKLFKRERPAVGRKQEVLVAPIFLPSGEPPNLLERRHSRRRLAR
jgi:hypothetical protein